MVTRLERGEDNVPLCAINRLQRPDIQGYILIYDDDKLFNCVQHSAEGTTGIKYVREGVTKKAAVLLDFVQITSPPPPPNLDNLYHFFNANVPKKSGRGLPFPPLPQIDPIYTIG